jgi:predicted PurR-regulated permease PerM
MMNNLKRTELSLQAIMMPILAMAAATAFFYYASPILVPIVSAAALTYLLLPVVDLIKKLKTPHAVAVLVVMLIVLGVFILLVILLVGQAASFATSFPRYKAAILSTLEEWGQAASRYLGNIPSLKSPESIKVNPDQLQSVGKYLLKGLGSVTSFLFGSALMFFLTLFMLLDSSVFEGKLRSIFGVAHAEATENILTEINRQIKGYIQIKFYVVIALSILFTLGLLVLRVPYAYIWGPLAGFLNLIPYVGSIVGAIPPIIVAGVQFGSFWPMLYVAIFFAVIQFAEGNFITPKLTSNSVDLNTLAVLVASMYWGWLWGGVGVILAIPITAAVKVICDHVEPLRPIGLMLGAARPDEAEKICPENDG